jgi:hypothetical protein
VPLTTLDDWLESAAVDPATITFVKIDTEGFEPKVLAGASRLLRIPNVAWQLEYAPAMMDAGGSDLGRYHEFLATRFSAVMDLRSVGGGLRPIRDLERLLAGRDQNHAYTDLLLISKGSG